MKRKPAISRTGDLTPRKQRRRIVESTLVLIGCLVLGDALIGERGLVATARARKEAETEQLLLQQERLKTLRLLDERQRLLSDLDTIEDAARRELGLIKPGEKLFIITDVPESSPR